jgi:hypothetical protein
MDEERCFHNHCRKLVLPLETLATALSIDMGTARPQFEIFGNVT